MRVLLDTNIIIHRENKRVSNSSIGLLFRWIDKLKYTKVIHPFSVEEIKRYKDPETHDVMAVKLEAYEQLKTVQEPDSVFLTEHGISEHGVNDHVDNCLLYEVFLGRVDVLITEDVKLRKKAELLGIASKVPSINQFISTATAMFPEQREYNVLSVKRCPLGKLDISDPFFDSFKRDYKEFVPWFNKKCDKAVYVCHSDAGDIQGLLYIKTEDEAENYGNITPVLPPKKRLKVGTFKVESTGFRLGERFVKIIFDNALYSKVDEAYVTLFEAREELAALAELLKRWGFIKHGIKKTANGEETVLVKKFNSYNPEMSVKANFPNMVFDGRKKFIMPILPQYHTTLLPDSKLKRGEVINLVENLPHRYALQKVYITFSPEGSAAPGDLILFYRMGPKDENKTYSSVLSTVGVVDELITSFKTKDEYLSHCQNRSVFTDQELEDFWTKQRRNLKILKFIYVDTLSKKPTLKDLWDQKVLKFPNGPRPFTPISDAQFKDVLKASNTSVNFV